VARDAVKVASRERGLAKTLAVVFFLGVGLGLITFPLFGDYIEDFAKKAYEGVLDPSSDAQTTLNILARNISASLIILGAGATIAGGALLIFANGYFAGLVVGFGLTKGVTFATLVKSVAAHFIPELAALFIAGAAGTRVGLSLARAALKGEWAGLKRSIRDAAAVFAFVVVPLLVIAAVLEVNVSLRLVSSTLRPAS